MVITLNPAALPPDNFPPDNEIQLAVTAAEDVWRRQEKLEMNFGATSRPKIVAGLGERAALTGAQDDYIRLGHRARNFPKTSLAGQNQQEAVECQFLSAFSLVGGTYMGMQNHNAMLVVKMSGR